MGDLLAYLEVGSLEEASDCISEGTDPDAYLFEENGAFVLRMGNLGSMLEFPVTVDDFWELVHDLENDVVTIAEADSRREPMSAELPAWDSADLYPSGESGRVARYRRLQSWYREHVLHARPGASGNYPALGSYLDADEVAANPRLNFLSDAALTHAEERITQVKAEGGSLDPVRLKRNMLSSMPMCFNLFGTMRGEPDFVEVFKELFDSAATAITEIVCEWAPRPTSEFLADRTAFDAVVFYETDSGPRFCGVETKYTESFSATEYENPRYATVTRGSGWFANPEKALVDLKGPKSNQLWRNVMLAAAVEAQGGHGTGWVAVVALADDPGAESAMRAVGSALTDSNRLKFVALESILDYAAAQQSLRDWSADFRQRYVGPLPG